jgi:cytidylate kinase
MKMRPPSRTIEQLVNEQVKEWEYRRAREKDREKRPNLVIAVSRLPGSGGRLFANRLAESLKIDFFDREIVHEIAESAHLSEALVNSLDERVRSQLGEWVRMLEDERHLWPYEYLHHLSKVIGTIARHGRAVILGRGAGFLLAQGECLRVLVVAPLETRVQRIARKLKLNDVEARRQVLRLENDRKAFIRKYFHAEMTEPSWYDVVFNTELMSIDDIMSASFALLRSQRRIP